MVSHPAIPAVAWVRYLRTAGLAVILAAVAYAVWYGLEHHAQRHGFFDLRIYRSAVAGGSTAGRCTSTSSRTPAGSGSPTRRSPAR